MCLADRCSLAVFTESTLDTGSIGPLRDVTGHQLLSTPSWGEIWSSLDVSRPCCLQCSSSLVSAWLQTRKRGSCLPELCFLSLSFGCLVDICDSVLGFGGFLAWWCLRFLVLVWSLRGLFGRAAPFIWFWSFVAFVRWDGKLVLNCSVVNLRS